MMAPIRDHNKYARHITSSKNVPTGKCLKTFFKRFLNFMYIDEISLKI